MSTLKVAAINNPSASSGGLAISASGNVTGAGLDLITTQSFSAVSSVSVNNCFTAIHDNYRVTLLLTAGANINMRLRASGSDITAANYRRQQLEAYNGTNVAGSEATSQTSWAAFMQFDVLGMGVIDVFQPQIADDTGLLLTSGKARQISLVAGIYQASTLVDGFSFYPDSGTITGAVSVYGYRK